MFPVFGFLVWSKLIIEVYGSVQHTNEFSHTLYIGIIFLQSQISWDRSISASTCYSSLEKRLWNTLTAVKAFTQEWQGCVKRTPVERISSHRTGLRT